MDRYCYSVIKTGLFGFVVAALLAALYGISELIKLFF